MSSERHSRFKTGTCYGLKDEPIFTGQGALSLPTNGYI
jgi:hypothetical protein